MNDIKIHMAANHENLIIHVYHTNCCQRHICVYMKMKMCVVLQQCIFGGRLEGNGDEES